MPTISVIMPAHNAAAFIGQAIESILSQTFTDFELIVVNDGSSDETASVVREYKRQDKRIKLVSYKKNKGESAAANTGFRQARGKYIARMDADDLSDKTRFVKQVAFLDSHPDYIVVGCQAEIIDGDNRVVGEKIFPVTNSEIYKQYGVLHPILHPAIMVRKSLLPKKNMLWAEKAEPNDDYFTLFELLHKGKFYNIPEKLVSYRMHDNNKSMQNVKYKFLNSLKIRAYAVRKFGYPLSFEMITKVILQSVYVLALPEWVTIGTYLWMRRMKPFDSAFPIVGELKKQARYLLANTPRFEYVFPMAVALLLQQFFTKEA